MIDSKRCKRCKRFCAPKSFRLIEDEAGVRLADLCLRCELPAGRRPRARRRGPSGLRGAWVQHDLTRYRHRRQH